MKLKSQKRGQEVPIEVIKTVTRNLKDGRWDIIEHDVFLQPLHCTPEIRVFQMSGHTLL